MVRPKGFEPSTFASGENCTMAIVCTLRHLNSYKSIVFVEVLFCNLCIKKNLDAFYGHIMRIWGLQFCESIRSVLCEILISVVSFMKSFTDNFCSFPGSRVINSNPDLIRQVLELRSSG